MTAPTDEQLDALARAAIPLFERIADLNPNPPMSAEYRRHRLQRRRKYAAARLRNLKVEAAGIIADMAEIDRELRELASVDDRQ